MEAREKQAYLRASPQQVATARTLLSSLLVQLQALGLFYQVAGWKVGGGVSSDSSLYERLATDASWDATGVARKIVGYFGPEFLNAQDSLRGIQTSLARWESDSPTSLNVQAQQAENDLQTMIVRADQGIRAVSAMTLGLSFFLKTLSDKHEGNLLALQQAVATKQASGTAEKLFHDNPEKREVLQLVRGTLPPTPVDIKKEPGGEGVSTLNRFVIDSLDERTTPAGAHNAIRKAISNRSVYRGSK